MGTFTLMKTSTFTDLQIIVGLKSGEDDNQLRQFQTLFFDRYKGYIYGVAIKRCRSYPDTADFATEITQQTFIAAFKGISKFDISQEVDSSKHATIIKAWLGRIANNCFNKEYAKRKNIILIDNLKSMPEEVGYDLFENLYGEEPIEIPNAFRSKLKEAMNGLTETQKHIIEVYASEGCINDPKKKLSKESMALLCKTHNTSSDNIRQIKKRTLDKIKTLLDKRINNKV